MVDVQWAFISLATASFAHFILRVVLGRELGTEGLGIYTLAFSIFLIGQQFAAFGVGSALTKYVAEFLDDLPKIRDYVSSGISSSIITGAIMGIGLFFMAPFIANNIFHTESLEGMIELVAFCLPFIAIQKAVLGTLNGFRRMRQFAFLNIAQNVSVVILSVSLVLFMHMGLIGAVVGFVIPTVAVGVASPLLIREHLFLKQSFWNVEALRATTSFGFYVGIGNAVGFLNTQIDSIFIGYYLDPLEVGIYAVSVVLAQSLLLVPSAVQRVTAPVTATLHAKKDIEGLRELFSSTLRKSFFLTATSAIFLAVSGPFVIDVLFGKDFNASYIPLLILLCGYVFGASFGAVGATLSSIGKVHVPVRVSAVCLLLNIILNMVLIPTLGIAGAALATITTMMVNFAITVKIVNYYLRKEALS